MTIHRFFFSFLGVLLFLAALTYDQTLHEKMDVPHETSAHLADAYVKQGVTRDGSLSLMGAIINPIVPPRLKYNNHSRTLRAFVAPNRTGLPTLYIESVIPNKFFTVVGSYTVSRTYPALEWYDEETILFYGVSADQIIHRVYLNVHNLSLIVEDVPDAIEATGT